MSEIRGCHGCQKPFTVIDLHTRFCNNCKKVKVVKKNIPKKIKIKVGEIIRKCKWCENVFDGSLGRKYCSDTCRTKYYSIPLYIEKAKIRITKQQDRIEFLESKL